MAPTKLQYRRTHNILLVNKLLSLRENASPFTLVLDSLEQSSRPLLYEIAKRAKIAKLKIVFVSFETLECPRDFLVVPAWRDAETWREQVAGHLEADQAKRKLLIFDTLNTLAAPETANLSSFLASFLNPTTLLVAVYHTDVASASSSRENPYSPTPLSLLKYLATTVFTTHSLHHILARRAAQGRSVVEPEFGLGENIDGVVQGLGANGKEGIVLEMEHRRRSGRGVREWYFMSSVKQQGLSPGTEGKFQDTIVLLEDHPQIRGLAVNTEEDIDEDNGLANSTFDLGLTEKQRLERDGVVLPYFDAQKGSGEGGRILYDMGVEDDFDEEEDEI